MKKAVFAFIMLILISAALPSFAEEIVTVTIPAFKVTLNGLEIDSASGEFPLIVYKDITYMPMTYDFTLFMGLKTEFGKTHGGSGEYAFYAGNCNKYAESLEVHESKTANDEKAYTALIPEYSIYVNNTLHKTDNLSEEYPVLNFRGITYFPLTWRFAHYEFDWEYSFDDKNGLIINSRGAFRPEWNPSRIYTTLPPNIDTCYVIGDGCYAGYPPSTYGNQYEFIWRKAGEDETVFSLKEALAALDITYFCNQADENGYATWVEPYLEGSILTIYCTGLGGEAVNPEKPWVHVKNWALKIDMEKGALISAEELPLTAVTAEGA